MSKIKLKDKQNINDNDESVLWRNFTLCFCDDHDHHGELFLIVTLIVHNDGVDHKSQF